ncbi:MAG: hypothetical protein RL291_1190 [Pseudomonadota bacterium]|jgi:hypothetical protein
MAISMYSASVPALMHQLTTLAGVIDKIEAHCAAKKIAPETMMNARLIADMLPFSRQVQIACDFAKGCAARLGGKENPSWADEEKTLADLKVRIKRTQEFVTSVSLADINGSENKPMPGLKVAGKPIKIDGQNYLHHFVLPNFYFHATMAYAIARANGVEIGKGDFLGNVPGLSFA